MMVNIGSKLRAALALQIDLDAFRQILQLIPAVVAGALVDWDEGAGEHWARVLLGDRVIAFVFTQAPLAIVRNDVYHALALELHRSAFVAVRVDSMDDSNLCSDREAVMRLAGRPISDYFAHEQFSAEELIWATM